MKTLFSLRMMLVLTLASPAFATVLVTSPSNGSTVNSSVNFVATANTTTCAKGVAAMGVYVDNSLQYVVKGTSLNTTLNLSSGKHNAVVQEWDFCGGATTAPVAVTVSTQAAVSVVSPLEGAKMSGLVPFVADATTSCRTGVSAIGVYVDDQLAFKVAGSKLNTAIAMAGGNHRTMVQEWDNCGGSATTPVNVTVAGTVMTNIQALPGWNQWGELAPKYDICTPCSGITWSMEPHHTDISLSGNATKFTVGGTTPYSDVLWSNPVLGQGAKNGLNDANHTLLPTLHDFTLDMSVYVTDLTATQDLEFDINWYGNGLGLEWGTECNVLGGGVWDIWNNVQATWVHTSIPCVLNNNAWNRVVLQVHRQANNDLLYQTLTVNGVTYNINQTVSPFPVPAGWWGMTVNYQMDGNSSQKTNTTYVDNMNFTYS